MTEFETRDILTIIVMILSGASVWQNLRIQNAMLEMRLHMAENYVKRSDFNSLTLTLLRKSGYPSSMGDSESNERN